MIPQKLKKIPKKKSIKKIDEKQKKPTKKTKP
jgi:hypothetical protein